MTTMTIKDHVSGRNVTVTVESSERIEDGTLYVVSYKAQTSAEVDCTFTVIEYDSGDFYCQNDWQCKPATADEIIDTHWADCTPTDDDDDDMLDVSETADMLGISRQRVHQLIQAGQLDGRKIGKTWYVYRDSVERRKNANRKLFERYELDAYLGDFADDFDVDAILEEATIIDPRTGNRYWKDGIDLADICAKHDVTAG